MLLLFTLSLDYGTWDEYQTWVPPAANIHPDNLNATFLSPP